MSGNRFNQTPREKNILDDRKLNLSGVIDNSTASLVWGLYPLKDGVVPRLTVYSNHPDDKDAGGLAAKMDLPTFYTFLEVLEAACNFVPTAEQPDFSMRIANMRPNFPKGGGRPDGVLLDTHLYIGRDKEGVVYVSVVQKNRNKIKFPFSFGEYHALQHGNGEPVGKAEASVFVARGYIRMLSQFIGGMAPGMWTPPVPKDRGGNGGGNGGGNRGGGQGNGGNYRNNNQSNGGNSSGGDVDYDSDDIPF